MLNVIQVFAGAYVSQLLQTSEAFICVNLDSVQCNNILIDC